ncbi:MAG: 3'(2'),5'-bisphosphate nucleotidase CysQ [Pseudomonadota bacterium]
MIEFDIARLVEIVRDAGDAILEVYHTDFEVANKQDESPLTQADLAAHKVIVAGLSEMTPDIPIISEESEPPGYAVRSGWARYWLVDPLDGTKEFVNRNGEFTVNIALIENHQAVAGIVGVPVENAIYVGDVRSGVAQKIEADQVTDLTPRKMQGPDQELILVASRSHGSDELESYIDSLSAHFASLDKRPVGSSLKLCTLAEGLADCYPRIGPTSEWDIGAAHAVLAAAGGAVWQLDGAALSYNSKESFLNPYFVAVADADFDWWSVLPAA